MGRLMAIAVALAMVTGPSSGPGLTAVERGAAGPEQSSGRAPGAPETAYGWPVAEVRVTRRFDPPPQPWLPGHRGVDLAGRVGTTVMAAGAGTVSFAGKVAGRGVVSIVHPDGFKTTYEPMVPTVAAGQPVVRGEAIGTLEYGHCEAEACLHWGAKRGDTYLDPLSLLGLGPIRLKPLNGKIRSEPAAPAARQPDAPRRRTRRRPDRRSAAAHRSR